MLGFPEKEQKALRLRHSLQPPEMSNNKCQITQMSNNMSNNTVK